MYSKILTSLLAVLVLTASTSSTVKADDAMRNQILKVLPQADTNSDGVISAEEQAAVVRQALERFPQLDRDDDGKLSDAEMRAMLRAAARRAGKNKPQPKANSNDSSLPKMNKEELLVELGLKAERDIEYRKNTGQPTNGLDFIFPKNKVYERAPLFIYIHGGGNTGGSKNVVYNKGDIIIKELTEAGIAVASINYRLMGKKEEVGFHELFQDCKDALRFLAKNSDRFEIDPRKMVTWGTSAGGSKALICALTKSDFLPGEVTGPGTEHKVVGAISFFGATTYLVPELWQKRLERFPTRSQTKGEMMFKPSGGLSTEQIRNLVSADQHLKATSPPILLVHGDTDPTVPAELSQHLYQQGKAKGADVTYVEVKNAGHGFKPVKGRDASMTWDDAQKLVVSHVLRWVK